MSFSTRIIVVFFLCFTSVLYGQKDLSVVIDSINKIKDKKERAQSLDQLTLEIDTTIRTKAQGALFHDISKLYRKLKNYEKALFYISQAIDIKRTVGDIEELNKSLFLKAYIYREQKEMLKAYKLCKEIVKPGLAKKATINAYQVLAGYEVDRGDYYKGLAHLNEAFSNQKLVKNAEFKSQISRAIIRIYSEMYQSDSGKEANQSDLEIVKLHQKTIEEYKEIIAEKPNHLAQAYNNLANIYDSFKAYDLALEFYKKAIRIYRENEFLYNELEVTINLGTFYSRQGKEALADEQFSYVFNTTKDKDLLANTYNSKGYYLDTVAVEKLPLLEKAVTTIIIQDHQDEKDFRFPSLEEIEASNYKQYLLVYLMDLTYYYVQAFHQNGGEAYLHKAKEAVVLIDNLVSLIRYDVDSDASKLFWIDKGVDIYMLAVEICYHLDDMESAFYFMEKNKALLLQEQIKTLQTKLARNIPETWLKREYKLYYEVLNLQAQFQRQPDNDSIRQAFAEKKKAQQVFMDSLQTQYPKYAKTKEKVEIVALHDITERHQQNDVAFVEYILDQKEGYGLFYDGNEPILFKIDNVETFQKQLQSLRTLMTKRVPDSQARKEMQTTGFQIFQQLFPFENALKRLQNKRIVIVADHTLQYIPFEILTTKKEGKLSDAYLINTTEISYVQSFSLFEQIRKKQNNPTKKLLAIAPIEFTNEALPTLADATNIVTSFTKDTTSVLLQKTQATKENFLKHRNDFEIIHLNTHGGLDSISQTPWLAFHDDEITLYELYGLENQAELVVLDACKTDDGVHLSGEGIINLSRGFFFNGTQSVLASQWKVNEQAGNKILQTFYKELADGKSKSKALQLAKINYLQNHKQPQTSPYYWATFKLTGSTDAVVQKSWLYDNIVTIGILILVCILVFFYFRKKKNK